MSVGELIKKLEGCDPSLPVVTLVSNGMYGAGYNAAKSINVIHVAPFQENDQHYLDRSCEYVKSTVTHPGAIPALEIW